MPITDIREFVDPVNPIDPGTSLVCETKNVNTQCCRGSDGGNVGEWFFPDGTMVPRNRDGSGNGFTRSAFMQQVRLNRKFDDVLLPTGVYECRVPGYNDFEYRANITLAISKSDTITSP